MSDTQAGIEPGKVTAWLRERVEALAEPLTFDLVAHGRSNLTFVMTDAAGRKWVLRRPPISHVLQSAHDMGREHKIIAALRDTDVPVPGTVGLCEDTEVNGAPFYVMHFVEGLVARSMAETSSMSEQARERIGTALVETMAKLHEIDPDAVGLGDLGRKEDYLSRQLRRWMTQVEKGSDREIPLITQVHAALQEKMPAQQGTGIVHGDYRLDNCMLTPDGEVAAVLDWELCTLGDVLADLGGFLNYAGYRPGHGERSQAQPIGGTEAIELYAKLSGRDVSGIDYYVAFANWRLACILEGVRFRFAKGAMGGKDIGPELQGYAQRIDAMCKLSASMLERL